MSYRSTFLIIYLFAFNAYHAHPPEYWLNYFKANPEPKLMTITKHRLGMNYIRGFPKGMLGTYLFPVLTEQGDEETKGIHFWMDYLASSPMLENSIVEEFQNFYIYTKKYFCKETDYKDWDCCTYGTMHPSCSQRPQRAMEVISLLIDPEQSLQIRFLYHWCLHAWHNIINLQVNEAIKTQALSYCPNPCHGNPCRSVKLAANTTYCEVVGTFEDDYKCQCDRRYEWDPYLKICTPKNPCLDNVFQPCKAENTVACLAKNSEEVLCVCKDEFMGVDCSLPRDACTERVNKSKQNGNTNCQVQFGNTCTPIIGTDQYICACNFGYVPSLTMAESNCLGRFDPCVTGYIDSESGYKEPDVDENRTDSSKLVLYRSVTCLNGGQCVTSADMTRAACVCPRASDGTSLFMGLNCEIAIGTWSGWSKLSPCLPSDCGQSRYRWRRRQCLNVTNANELANINELPEDNYSAIDIKFIPHIRCPGTSEEVLPCDLMEPCASLRLPGRLRNEIFDYNSLYYFGYVTLAEVVFSVLVWYVFANPVIALLQKQRRQKPEQWMQ